MADAPETLSHEEVRRTLHGGPDPRNAVLVVIGGRMYKNEGTVWRLVDSRTYSTLKEIADADGT